MSITTTGATISTYGTTTLYTFNSSGSFTCTTDISLTVLIVGGGGGGGGYRYDSGVDTVASGGGGGGGVGIGTLLFPMDTYTVTVGSGGNGSTGENGAYSGSNGSNSSIINSDKTVSETANGGGGGFGGVESTSISRANSGGSGGGSGGGANYNKYFGGEATKGSGKLTYYGNTGGNGSANIYNFYTSGGGGGALTAGSNSGNAKIGGNGGSGILFSVNNATYGGGGGGGGGLISSSSVSNGGMGGIGGGGEGGSGGNFLSRIVPKNGSLNTGGGGGGAGRFSIVGSYAGGNGGSGIVIIAVQRNLVLYYPFDVDMKNYATDPNGVLERTAIKDRVTISTTNTLNTSGSLYFPGGNNPNQVFQAPPIPEGLILKDTGMTFSVWVKFVSYTPFSKPNFKIFDFTKDIVGANGNDPAWSKNSVILYYYNQFDSPNANYLLVSTKGTTNLTEPKYNNERVTLNDNIWHHYCVTFSSVNDGSFNFNLYLDGVPVVTQNSVDSSIYPDLPFNTCLIGNSSYALDHTSTQPTFYVNNFRLYSKELSVQEVTNLYLTEQNGKLSAIQKLNYWGLLLYYPFEEDVSNYATGTGINDACNNTGVITTTNTSRTGGKSYSTESNKDDTGSVTNKYYFKSSVINLKQCGFTVSCWVKFININQSGYPIFEIGNIDLTYGYVYNVYIVLEIENNKLLFYTTNDDSHSKNLILSTGSYSLDYVNISNYNYVLDLNWHHYCVSVDANSITSIYVDGLRVYSGNNIRVHKYNTNMYAQLGANTNFNNTILSYYNAYPSAYYNSLIVLNRGISPSEIGLLMGVKNTVLNGYFNSMVSGSPSSANVYSLTNGNFLYDPSSLTGWDNTTGNARSVLNVKSTAWTPTNTILYNLLNNQQYWIGTQCYRSNKTYKQHIYLESGNYVFNYKAFYRNDISSTTLTSSILYKTGLELASSKTLSSLTTPALSYTSIYTHDQSFNVITSGVYTIQFVFTNALGTDSTIFLSGVKVNPIRIPTTAYSMSSSSKSIDSSMQLVDIRSGKKELTNPPLNNYSIFNNYKLNNNPLSFSGRPLYMHGPRNKTGFQINGVDIGMMFQQSDQLDASGYGYCFANNYDNDIGYLNRDPMKASLAQVIWPENAFYANGPIYYWLYYTFYYSGVETSGNAYALVDDVATIYFNGIKITPNNVVKIYDYQASTSLNYTYTFTNLVNGLNYIRVAVLNAGPNANGATFVAAFYDNANTLLAITNQNWTWSNTLDGYRSDTSYNDVRGALPFYRQNGIYSTLDYKEGGTDTPQFPVINGYKVLYITSGTGIISFSQAVTIKNIFLVGGGAGGMLAVNNDSGIETTEGGYQGLGGDKRFNDVNNLVINPTDVFNISIGNGGDSGSSGFNTTVTCITKSISYTASGGMVATDKGKVRGFDYSYNGLTYGGSGGPGYPTDSTTELSFIDAPIGGGGGGGGGFDVTTGKRGGKGGGISPTLVGGAGGTGGEGGDGVSSLYGGGGGGGLSASVATNRVGGKGGSGTSMEESDSDKLASTNNNVGGAGGGGKNTGGGGGGGSRSGLVKNNWNKGGKGGSGIVIIVYQ